MDMFGMERRRADTRQMARSNRLRGRRRNVTCQMRHSNANIAGLRACFSRSTASWYIGTFAAHGCKRRTEKPAMQGHQITRRHGTHHNQAVGPKITATRTPRNSATTLRKATNYVIADMAACTSEHLIMKPNLTTES